MKLMLNVLVCMYCLLNDKKRSSKTLVQGHGVQKTFWLSSRTPKKFNVMPRKEVKISKLKSHLVKL